LNTTNSSPNNCSNNNNNSCFHLLIFKGSTFKITFYITKNIKLCQSKKATSGFYSSIASLINFSIFSASLSVASNSHIKWGIFLNLTLFLIIETK